jgi:hypothetical protein
MNKKAIIILATIFLLIVGTLGFLIYSRYSNNQSDNTDTANNNEAVVDNIQPAQPEGGSGNNPTTTPVSTEKFIKLTQGDSVISPILFYNGNGVTYMTESP